MKALIIIAFRDYQDKEFIPLKDAFDKQGINYDIASTQKGLAKGVFGNTQNVSLILEDVLPKVQEYNCVVFIGGPGTPNVRRKTEAVKIAENAYKKNKLVCAICWSSTILAKAGILKNKKATVWLGYDDEYQKNTSEVLEQYGCDFVNKDLVVDKNIITANGPEAADKFAKEIVKYLSKK